MKENKCRNCGKTIEPEDFAFIANEIQKLEEELETKKRNLEAMKNGFCDTYCERNYRTNF